VPTALVPLAEGVEEMEAVIAVDTLRRAGWSVTVAGLAEGPTLASRGVRLLADQPWDAVRPETFDVLVIPGGAGGVTRLAADERVLNAARQFARDGKWIAAVCAGPLVLQAAGLLAGRRVTCHPAAAPKLTAAARLPDRVVVDGRLVTSQGPGTSFEFALTLVKHLDGPAKAVELAAAMVLPADLAAALP
jgi:4-methyl-5(b-hydroxyethyl)-thiazole monophosphate biosynthesis